MIVVNVAMGYSGIFLFHIEDLETERATSHWVPPSIVHDIFKRNSEYMSKIQDSWKARPTKRSRNLKTIKLEENPNGELGVLIEQLLKRLDNG